MEQQWADISTKFNLSWSYRYSI